MTPKLKRAMLPAAGGLLVFVALAEWLLWLMPPPHRPLEYMIAGTAATAAALGVAFALVVMGFAGCGPSFARIGGLKPIIRRPSNAPERAAASRR